MTVWIEALRHDLLTPLFKALSFTGEPTFFLLAFTVGYWLFDRQIFTRATLLVATIGLANSVLKAIFQVPRPDPALALAVAEGWSFPSGHAMVAGAIWPWLALEYRRATERRRALPWVWTLAWTLALGVAFSRVYLGVHTLRDVSWGLLLGALVMVLIRHWSDTCPPAFWQRLGQRSRFLYLTLAVVPAVFSFPIYQHDTTGAKAGGVFLTLWLGARQAHRLSPGLPRGPARLSAAVAIGLAGTFALRWGLKELLPDHAGFEAMSDFVRYGAIGTWVALGAPLAFRAFRLVRQPP